jgi:Sap, sulfolipid-1-addressing protein
MSLLITILVLGLLASLSPTTILVFILLLSTARARPNAAAFLIGWSISLTVVFAFSYFLGGAHSMRQHSGRIVVDAIEILLGIALIGVGAREWRKRNEPRERAGVPSSLAVRLNRVNPVQATMVGVLEQPWTITAAAAVVVARHHAALVVAVLAFLVFTFVSTATVGLIFLYHGRHPGEAEAQLSALRDRVIRAGPALLTIVSLAVGVYLIADGALGMRKS